MNGTCQIQVSHLFKAMFLYIYSCKRGLCIDKQVHLNQFFLKIKKIGIINFFLISKQVLEACYSILYLHFARGIRAHYTLRQRKQSAFVQNLYAVHQHA